MSNYKGNVHRLVARFGQQSSAPSSPASPPGKPLTTSVEAVEVALCKVSGPGISKDGVPLGQQTSFTVNTAGAGMGKLLAYLTTPSGKKLHVKSKRTDPFHMFLCTFVPEEVGRHGLVLTYGGHSLPNSPITVQVKDPKPISEQKPVVKENGVGPGKHGISSQSQVPNDVQQRNGHDTKEAEDITKPPGETPHIIQASPEANKKEEQELHVSTEKKQHEEQTSKSASTLAEVQTNDQSQEHSLPKDSKPAIEQKLLVKENTVGPSDSEGQVPNDVHQCNGHDTKGAEDVSKPPSVTPQITPASSESNKKEEVHVSTEEKQHEEQTSKSASTSSESNKKEEVHVSTEEKQHEEQTSKSASTLAEVQTNEQSQEHSVSKVEEHPSEDKQTSSSTKVDTVVKVSVLTHEESQECQHTDISQTTASVVSSSKEDVSKGDVTLHATDPSSHSKPTEKVEVSNHEMAETPKGKDEQTEITQTVVTTEVHSQVTVVVKEGTQKNEEGQSQVDGTKSTDVDDADEVLSQASSKSESGSYTLGEAKDEVLSEYYGGVVPISAGHGLDSHQDDDADSQASTDCSEAGSYSLDREDKDYTNDINDIVYFDTKL